MTPASCMGFADPAPPHPISMNSILWKIDIMKIDIMMHIEYVLVHENYRQHS